jgi:hypothetical protein
VNAALLIAVVAITVAAGVTYLIQTGVLTVGTDNEAEWFSGLGTWVGGIATVGTLIYLVRQAKATSAEALEIARLTGLAVDRLADQAEASKRQIQALGGAVSPSFIGSTVKWSGLKVLGDGKRFIIFDVVLLNSGGPAYDVSVTICGIGPGCAPSTDDDTDYPLPLVEAFESSGNVRQRILIMESDEWAPQIKSKEYPYVPQYIPVVFRFSDSQLQRVEQRLKLRWTNYPWTRNQRLWLQPDDQCPTP